MQVGALCEERLERAQKSAEVLELRGERGMQRASFCDEGLQVEVSDVEDIRYVLRELRRFAFQLDDVLHLLNEKHRNYNYKRQPSLSAVRGALGLNYIGYNKSLEWSSPCQPASPSTG